MNFPIPTQAKLWYAVAFVCAIALPPSASGALPRPSPGLGQNPEVLLPDTPKPPAAPVKLDITGRTPDSVSISWRDRSATEESSELQRRGSTGSSWTVVRQWGPLDGTASHTDSGLSADVRYCYRVRVSNSVGESFSPQRCVYTRDGRGNEVWRLQLELRTAGVDNADTDDGVQIRLNAPPGVNVPAGNETWLDYARNDFEKGDIFAYDLNLGGIGEIGDITQLTISKNGSDGWCLAHLALKANGLEIYSEDFSNEPAGCRWLDNENGHQRSYTVSHEKLRDHSSWVNYNSDGAALLLLAVGIPAEEMVSRIEANVGDSLHGENLYWGHLHGPGVEVKRGCQDNEAACQKIHFDLDLAADVTALPDPEVDVDFDLDISCREGEFSFKTENVKIEADSSWFWEVLSAKLIEILDVIVEGKVKDGWAAIDKSFDVDTCPSIQVDNGANVRFELPAQSNPGGNTIRPDAPTTGTLAPATVETLVPAHGTPLRMRR